MRNRRQIATIAIVVLSAALFAACVGSEVEETQVARSPVASDQLGSPQVKVDTPPNLDGQSDQSRFSLKEQDHPRSGSSTEPVATPNASQTAPEVGKKSKPNQESDPLFQFFSGPGLATAEPDPAAQASIPPISEPTEATPLQSSKAVEVDVNQFRQLLPKDAIAPIYTPLFLPAKEAALEPAEMVIGVELDGQSNTYPIGPLARREMVNDVIAGVPILVTW